MNFRQFLEDGYTDKLQDELGIDPETIGDSPQWAANIGWGGFSYNGMTYKFKYTRDSSGKITGAMVKPIDLGRAYVDRGGKKMRVPAGDTSEKFVSIDDLNKMMTQGLQQPPAPEMGADMGGGMPSF
jgi:hypothetical protein